MTDILKQIEAALNGDSHARSDEALDAAYVEIERLRDMCINREEFIAQHNLWKEFSQYLSEPHSAVSSTDGGGAT